MSNERYAEFQRVAAAVARTMGFKIEQRSEWYADLYRESDQARLGLRFDGHKERVEVSGSYPQSLEGRSMSARDWGACEYNESPVSITVAMNRGSNAIVREIERRLLPDYLPRIAKAVERLHQHEGIAAKTAKNAEQLAKLLADYHPRVSESRSNELAKQVECRYDFGLSVYVYGDELRVKLERDLSFDQLNQLVDVLKRIPEKADA